MLKELKLLHEKKIQNGMMPCLRSHISWFILFNLLIKLLKNGLMQDSCPKCDVCCDVTLQSAGKQTNLNVRL